MHLTENLLYLRVQDEVDSVYVRIKRKVIMFKKEMIGNIDVSGWRISGEKKKDLQGFVNNDPTLEELV